MNLDAIALRFRTLQSAGRRARALLADGVDLDAVIARLQADFGLTGEQAEAMAHARPEPPEPSEPELTIAVSNGAIRATLASCTACGDSGWLPPPFDAPRGTPCPSCHLCTNLRAQARRINTARLPAGLPSAVNPSGVLTFRNWNCDPQPLDEPWRKAGRADQPAPSAVRGSAEESVRGWVTAVASWTKNQPSPGNLVLAGDPGVGKTHLLAAAGWALVRQAGVDVRFREWRELVDELLGAVKTDGARSVVETYVTTPVLLIDEVGGRTPDFALDRIADIVTRRYAAGRPIAIATNYSVDAADAAHDPASLKNWVSAHIFSRLTHGRVVSIYGPDMRGAR